MYESKICMQLNPSSKKFEWEFLTVYILFMSSLVNPRSVVILVKLKWSHHILIEIVGWQCHFNLIKHYCWIMMSSFLCFLCDIQILNLYIYQNIRLYRKIEYSCWIINTITNWRVRELHEFSIAHQQQLSYICNRSTNVMLITKSSDSMQNIEQIFLME